MHLEEKKQAYIKRLNKATKRIADRKLVQRYLPVKKRCKREEEEINEHINKQKKLENYLFGDIYNNCN